MNVMFFLKFTNAMKYIILNLGNNCNWVKVVALEMVLNNIILLVLNQILNSVFKSLLSLETALGH